MDSVDSIRNAMVMRHRLVNSLVTLMVHLDADDVTQAKGRAHLAHYGMTQQKIRERNIKKNKGGKGSGFAALSLIACQVGESSARPICQSITPDDIQGLLPLIFFFVTREWSQGKS